MMYEIQGETVKHILEENGFTQIEVIKDLAHKDRIVLGRFTFEETRL